MIEANAKRSAATKAQWEDSAKRARLEEAIREAVRDKAARRKMSEAAKARWANPEKRAALVAKMTKAKL